MGENDLRISFYGVTTGGCRDGLHPERVNENQGAESTLAFLMALAEVRSFMTTSLNQVLFALKFSLVIVKSYERCYNNSF